MGGERGLWAVKGDGSMRNRGLVAVALATIMLVAGALLFSAGSDEPEPVAAAVDDSLLRAPVVGRADLDRSIALLEDRVDSEDDDWYSRAGLAAAYLQKARETADPAYYERASAELQRSLEIRRDNLPALLGMGQLDLARHDFDGARVWGRKALEVDDASSIALGIIADALLELGRYDKGFKTIQQMVNLRPDLSSYARVAYARELTGDTDGAIAAMRLAHDAASGVPFNAAWTSNEVGDLYFSMGRLDKASDSYRLGRRFAPSYLAPLAGLARVHAAHGNLQKAIESYRRVVESYPLPQYVVELGDVYLAAGRSEPAEQQYELAEAQQQLFEANGVLPDVETTLFLADHGIKPDIAVDQARRQYDARPSIRAADALAWALYSKGRYAEAQRYSRLALRLGTRNALWHFHAGMIAAAHDDDATARSHLETALEINPHFSVLQAPAARRTLERL